MKVQDNLHLALRMFKTRPMRTSLTILGVSVGIGTVLFLVSLGYGLQQTILNRIANADTLLTLDVSAGSDAVQLTAENIAKITAIPHVTETSRLANVPALLSFGGINTDTAAVAVDPSFFRLDGIAAVAGKLFEGGEKGAGVLSTAAVKLLGKTPEDITGKSASTFLTLTNEVEGAPVVTELSGSTLIVGVVENEDMSEIFVPLSALGDAVPDSFDRLKVKVERNDFMEEVRNAILDQGFVVSSLGDTIDQANKIFRIVQLVLGLFGLVALIVSAIGMFNTMTIALMERTSEIGIMRSIGITRGDIRKMFLVESMLMGFLGGLVGLILSTVAGKAVNFGINVLAARYDAPAVNIFLTPAWFMLVVIGFSTIIGFLTGVYPSIRASKLNPLDALRYK
jgi:ABC-type antimicrobial peptide transport system permease subunit